MAVKWCPFSIAPYSTSNQFYVITKRPQQPSKQLVQLKTEASSMLIHYFPVNGIYIHSYLFSHNNIKILERYIDQMISLQMIQVF